MGQRHKARLKRARLKRRKERIKERANDSRKAAAKS